MLILILILVIAGIVIAVLATARAGNVDPGDNDFTGSNANFGKSLMGDDDEFGKGL